MRLKNKTKRCYCRLIKISTFWCKMMILQELEIIHFRHKTITQVLYRRGGQRFYVEDSPPPVEVV